MYKIDKRGPGGGVQKSFSRTDPRYLNTGILNLGIFGVLIILCWRVATICFFWNIWIILSNIVRQMYTFKPIFFFLKDDILSRTWWWRIRRKKGNWPIRFFLQVIWIGLYRYHGNAPKWFTRVYKSLSVATSKWTFVWNRSVGSVHYIFIFCNEQLPFLGNVTSSIRNISPTELPTY